MALNPDPVGAAIANFVQTVRPAPGAVITNEQLIALWQGIVKIIYDDLKINQEILPGSFVVTGVQAGSDTVPVSGVGGPSE